MQARKNWRTPDEVATYSTAKPIMPITKDLQEWSNGNHYPTNAKQWAHVVSKNFQTTPDPRKQLIFMLFRAWPNKDCKEQPGCLGLRPRTGGEVVPRSDRPDTPSTIWMIRGLGPRFFTAWRQTSKGEEDRIQHLRTHLWTTTSLNEAFSKPLALPEIVSPFSRSGSHPKFKAATGAQGCSTSASGGSGVSSFSYPLNANDDMRSEQRMGA